MVALEGVQKAYLRMTYRCIHQLIYPRQGEMVLWESFIQIRKIYTYSPLPSFLFHHHCVGQPLGVKHLFYGPSLFEFKYFPLNNVRMFPR